MVFLNFIVLFFTSYYADGADFSGLWHGSASLVTINEPPDEGVSQFFCSSMSLQMTQTLKTLQIKKLTYLCDFSDGTLEVETKGPVWQVSLGKIYYNGFEIGTISPQKITIISGDAYSEMVQSFVRTSQGLIFEEKETRQQDGKVIWHLKSNLLK